MCETSNRPAAVRTATCSCRTPSYCTGMSHPANGTMRAPARTWASCRGVRFRAAAVDKARKTLATLSGSTALERELTAAGISAARRRARLVHDLAPADPDHVPAGERELEVAAAILLELMRRVVGRAPVGLDDQAM